MALTDSTYKPPTMPSSASPTSGAPAPVQQFNPPSDSTPKQAPQPLNQSVPSTNTSYLAQPTPAPVQPTPVQETAKAPIYSPPPATKTTATRVEQAQEMQDDFMSYVQQVQEGKDPISSQMFNNLLKAQNAQGQATIDRYIQGLKQQGLDGQGSGNAMLSMMARDLSTSQAALKSQLSTQMLSRIDSYNKLGWDVANTVERKERSSMEGEIDSLIRGGFYAEATKKSAEMADIFGTEPVDYTSEESIAKRNSDRMEYQAIQNDLETRYSNGLLSYEQFKDEWQKKAQNSESFARYAGTSAPSESQIVITKMQQQKEAEIQSTYNMANILVTNGNLDGAESIIRGMYEPGGSLESTGLDPNTQAQAFRSMTPQNQAILTTMEQSFISMLQNGDKAGAESLAGVMSRMYPESDYVQNLYGNINGSMKGWFDSVSNLESQAFRAQKAEKASTLSDLASSQIEVADPKQLAVWENEWKSEFRESMTSEELDRKVRAFMNIEDGDIVSESDIQNYLSNTWDSKLDMSNPTTQYENQVKTTVSALKSTFGADRPEEVAALESYISKLYAPLLANGEPQTPSFDEFLSTPETYLAFNDFNGEPKGPDWKPDATYIATKKDYDAYLQQARREGLTDEQIILPTFFNEARNAWNLEGRVGSLQDYIYSETSMKGLVRSSGLSYEELRNIVSPNSLSTDVTESISQLHSHQVSAILGENPNFFTQAANNGNLQTVKDLDSTFNQAYMDSGDWSGDIAKDVEGDFSVESYYEGWKSGQGFEPRYLLIDGIPVEVTASHRVDQKTFTDLDGYWDDDEVRDAIFITYTFRNMDGSGTFVKEMPGYHYEAFKDGAISTSLFDRFGGKTYDYD